MKLVLFSDTADFDQDLIPVLFTVPGLKVLFYQTGEFDWSDDIQGVVLSAFTYGYISTQLLGGFLSVRFGAKKTTFWGIALSAFGTLISPLAAIGSPYLLIAAQILNGFGQVSIFSLLPATFEIFSRPNCAVQDFVLNICSCVQLQSHFCILRWGKFKS